MILMTFLEVILLCELNALLRNNLPEKSFIYPKGIPLKKIALSSPRATALKARLLVLLKRSEANLFLRKQRIHSYMKINFIIYIR